MRSTRVWIQFIWAESSWTSLSPTCTILSGGIGSSVQVAETLLGDEAPCDGLERTGLAGDGDVVLLTGSGVLEDDVPVAELLVVELVFLELDALEGAGDGPVGCRFAVSLADDGAF